jgi:hypothetical protein
LSASPTSLKRGVNEIQGLPKNELAMFGENVAETERKFVLQVLQFAVGVDIIFVWLGGFAGSEFNELIGDFGDGSVFALLLTPAPEGLKRCAISCAFSDFQGDNFGIEDVGHDLTPDFGFGPAARGTDLGRLDAEFCEATQAVIHAESDAFH